MSKKADANTKGTKYTKDTKDASNEKHLSHLYGFLYNNRQTSEQKREGLLTSIQKKVTHSISTKQQFFDDNAESLIDAAQAIADIYNNNGRMFSMGNGGSSCDAAHFAVEFQHPVTTGRPALAATNLMTDMAMVSAVANDLGIQHVFSRQIDAHGRTEDGLMGFSTSGNSKDLMEGYRKAKELGMVTFGMAGGDGGTMKSSHLVDHCLVVETDSIHRVQESHVTCYHIIWDLVHTLLANQRGKVNKK